MKSQQPFILLVEDDDDLRSIVSRSLQAAGYMVFQAATFREAVDRMAIKPNLLILDIHLPDATGWDVADWLENHTTPVPVIVISGATTPTAKQWERFTPKAFLPKPFSIDDLLTLVEEQVPSSRTNR